MYDNLVNYFNDTTANKEDFVDYLMSPGASPAGTDEKTTAINKQEAEKFAGLIAVLRQSPAAQVVSPKGDIDLNEIKWGNKEAEERLAAVGKEVLSGYTKSILLKPQGVGRFQRNIRKERFGHFALQHWAGGHFE